ncbi:MAG: energy transducer TonB [Wenzhouxiangellaceae bacterium]|nr:energy transducer TonB [Wenzhouxiangellaceae bacterium]MBS3746038.1 energy transducer TonB [Wenzhouxiangellaceae bacterium]MBS3823763.1 energy transducer TonB [Wenzhouxiangellaceae bacterium]
MTSHARKRARNETETLGLALVLAVVLHVAVITQLHFDWINASFESRAPDLDVILVDWASEKAPEQADFLAQANQTGGGDNPELERPSAPPPAEAAGNPEPRPEPSAQPQPEAEAAEPELVARRTETPELEQREDPPLEEKSLPDASQLLQQARNVAQTAPDPLASERILPKRPRRKFITANTREHLYASYMRNWVAKVERVGNMNYPEQARRRNLEGSLVLSVDVLADGSIERVQVLRSSGYELLDEAAVRIVRLAAPYAELPPEVRKETDILTVTRTWEFSATSGLK